MLVSLLLALPSCGGTFCNAVQFQPVIQTGEGIVFFVDRDQGTVDAVINIQYEGSAPEFAWVLPLQSAPLSLRVAPQFLFSAVDRQTAPQFAPTFETRGTCEQPPFPANGAQDAGGLSDAGATSKNGIEVLFQSAIEPYDTMVIQSSDPAEMRTWLETNGYFVTDEIMDAVVPYVSKGDTLLALKLLNGKSAGDIQPIWVEMQGNEVCVPIRLTAIAAVEDMDITTTILSNEGRAIPENYFHVELNLPRIDWLRNGANYRQLVAQAADEGTGNAFVTEYAGSARTFDNRLYPSGFYSRAAIESALPDASSVIIALSQQNLTIHPEVAAVLLEAIDEPALAKRFITPQQFLNCPSCFSFQLTDIPLDPAPIAESVWSRVVQPLADLQQEFNRYTYATRLFTMISPDEMMIDPDFSFRTDLPEVSNVHRARIISDCTDEKMIGDAPLEIHIEETEQIVGLHHTSNVVDDDYLNSLPTSIRIEQLAEQRLIEEHQTYIDSILEEHHKQINNPTFPRNPQDLNKINSREPSTYKYTTTASSKS